VSKRRRGNRVLHLTSKEGNRTEMIGIFLFSSSYSLSLSLSSIDVHPVETTQKRRRKKENDKKMKSY
jgi:hypothetical protein